VLPVLGLSGEMMKVLKKIVAVIIVLLIVCFSIIASSAATVFDYEGYSYTIVTNKYISLVGWDNRSPDLVVPDSISNRYVMSVGNYALSQNEAITSVDFSNAKHLKRIGMSAFQECKNLNQELILPETISEINECAFQECSSIPSVVINAKINEIPDQCFYKCENLTHVTLNDNIERIGYYAFADCPQLQRVDIPKSVATIGKSSFQNDPNLTLGVWYGSYGYEYAIARNIPYIILDVALLGDANGDGSVNINDVTTIQRYLAELETLEGIYLHAADANQDGTVDIADATAIQMYLAEYEMEYPIGVVMTQ